MFVTFIHIRSWNTMTHLFARDWQSNVEIVIYIKNHSTRFEERQTKVTKGFVTKGMLHFIFFLFFCKIIALHLNFAKCHTRKKNSVFFLNSFGGNPLKNALRHITCYLMMSIESNNSETPTSNRISQHIQFCVCFFIYFERHMWHFAFFSLSFSFRLRLLAFCCLCASCRYALCYLFTVLLLRMLDWNNNKTSSKIFAIINETKNDTNTQTN